MAYGDITWVNGAPMMETLTGQTIHLSPLAAASYSDPKVQAWAKSQGAAITPGPNGQENVTSGAPSGSLLKNQGTWNTGTGQWDQGLNWGNLLSMVAAGFITAGAADALMSSGAIAGVPSGVTAVPEGTVADTSGGLGSIGGAGAADSGSFAGAGEAGAAEGAVDVAGGLPATTAATATGAEAGGAATGTAVGGAGGATAAVPGVVAPAASTDLAGSTLAGLNTGAIASPTSTLGIGSTVGGVNGATIAAPTLTTPAATTSDLATTPVAGLNTGAIAAPTSASTGAVGLNQGGSIMQNLLGNNGAVNDAGNLLGKFAAQSAANRATTGEFTQKYDAQALADQTGRNQNESDALRKLYVSNYLQNQNTGYTPTTITLNGQQVKLPDYGFGFKAPSAAQKQGAGTLVPQLLQRLQPGGSVSPTPLSNYTQPGAAENAANYGSYIAGGLGVLNKADPNWASQAGTFIGGLFS